MQLRHKLQHGSFYFYTLPHDSGRVSWLHIGRPCVCPSVRQSYICPSVFYLRIITWVNINGFSPNLVCAWILWRSGFGLLFDKNRQILTDLSARDTPIFLFLDNNLSNCQGVLTKLGICIDMKEICFKIANGQISSMFDRVICPWHDWWGIIV